MAHWSNGVLGTLGIRVLVEGTGHWGIYRGHWDTRVLTGSTVHLGACRGHWALGYLQRALGAFPGYRGIAYLQRTLGHWETYWGTKAFGCL